MSSDIQEAEVAEVAAVVSTADVQVTEKKQRKRTRKGAGENRESPKEQKAKKKRNEKAAVFRGSRDKTQGGLTKDSIKQKQIGVDESGKPVFRYISRRKSEIGTERYKDSKLQKWNRAVQQVKGSVMPVKKSDEDYAKVRAIYEEMLKQSSPVKSAEQEEEDQSAAELDLAEEQKRLLTEGVLTQAY